MLAASCGGGGLPSRDASADRIHDAIAGGFTSAASSSAGNAGTRGSGGATGGSGGSNASSSTNNCLYADCKSSKYRCPNSAAYQRVRTVECKYEKDSICGLDTCGTRCIADGDPVSCPADMACVDVYGRDPAYACQPDSGAAGRGGSSGGNTPTTPSSGGVGGQRSSSGGSPGSSGGTSGQSSNTRCSAADCYNITYKCLDSKDRYQRLKTVNCANDKSGVCGTETCGTRCVNDGDPILCPAGTSCQLVFRPYAVPWSYPEDACQPLPDGGMNTTDADFVDASARDARSN